MPRALHRACALGAVRCSLAVGEAQRRSVAGRASAVRAAAAAEEDDEPWEIDLQVTGMVCDGCSSNVKNALAAAKGVSGVEVDLASGVATVQVQAENAVREHAQLSLSGGEHPPTRSAQVDAVRVAGDLAAAVKAAGFECSPIL